MHRLSNSVYQARRDKVLSFVNALPEASATIAGYRHFRFNVRGRTFGYFLNDHHGDERVALNCKAASGVNTTLARVASDHFFIPKYVGARGWLGLWLDLPKVDWRQVEDVIREAYCLVAPHSLAAKLKRPNQALEATAGRHDAHI
jgi:hypothetical protein